MVGNWRLKKIQDPAKSSVDGHCVVKVVDKKSEAIGRLHQTIQNANEGINIISSAMGGMVQDLYNMGKDMDYYAAKLHQVEKRVELSNMFFLWLFFSSR